MKFNFLHSAKALLCFVALSLFTSQIRAQAPYCGASYFQGCGLGCEINDFIVNGESPTAINDVATGCVVTGAPLPGSYYDNRLSESVTFKQGLTYSLSVSGGAMSITPDNVQIWIDFDNSNSFDAGEEIGGGALTLAGLSTTITLTIPGTAALGSHRMRACVSGSETYPGLNPCPTIAANPNGETVDYTVVIVASGPVCTAPSPVAGSITCTGATISWAAVGGATGYEYLVDGSSGSPSGSGTATTGTSYSPTGLSSGTTYYAHVRTNCGSGFSAWVTIPFTTTGPAPITGTAALCPSSTTNLSDAVPGGAWSSSNTGVATVSSTGVVYGITAGTTTISYVSGGCTATISVTVGTLPAIVGTTSVCPGSTTQLSDAVPGGTWSSSTPSVATVSGAGLVYGNTNGTTVITYSASGCSTTATVTVSALPPITGGNSVCVGLTLALSNATGGGVWSSSNTANATVSSTGVVTGAAVGTTTIVYTLGGCSVSNTVTVGAAIAPVTGTTTFCVTGSTSLSDATPGGTWSSGNVSVATVSGSVVVHGASAGTATISYTIGSCSATSVVTVDPNNGGTISGADSICKGPGNTVALTASQSGGVWSSSNTTRGTVDPSTGVVTAASTSGSFVISYVVTNTCGTYTVTHTMYIRPASRCSTGLNSVAVAQGDLLKVFPNPNGGTFTMNLVSDIDENVHVVVTNMVGEKVTELITTTNNAVDLKMNVAPGIYILSASTLHGKYVAKVVVQK